MKSILGGVSMTDGGKAVLRLDLAFICSVGTFPLISRPSLYVRNILCMVVIFHGTVVKVLLLPK